MDNMITLIIGESASGKDSLANLLEQDGYKVLKSYTTRLPRPNEGNTHIFIRPEEVEKYRDSFIAYTKIGSYEYFATLDQLKESDIYIIDPEGYRFLKEKIPSIKIIPIYINVNESTRYNRALKRVNYNEKQKKETEDRFIAEYKQFLDFKSHDEFYSVINHDVDKAFKIIKNIIEIEKGK